MDKKWGQIWMDEINNNLLKFSCTSIFIYFLSLRGCDSFQCLDCCQVIALVQGNNLYPLQTNASSCQDGLLEPACRIGYDEMTTASALPTCLDIATVNWMAVAILNSDAHAPVHKHGNYADYSPCHTLFDYRYALGLHTANHDDLTRFQSRDDYHNYVSYINYMSV